MLYENYDKRATFNDHVRYHELLCWDKELILFLKPTRNKDRKDNIFVLMIHGSSDYNYEKNQESQGSISGKRVF